jgi:hypothetical protein
MAEVPSLFNDVDSHYTATCAELVFRYVTLSDFEDVCSCNVTFKGNDVTSTEVTSLGGTGGAMKSCKRTIILT